MRVIKSAHLESLTLLSFSVFSASSQNISVSAFIRSSALPWKLVNFPLFRKRLYCRFPYFRLFPFFLRFCAKGEKKLFLASWTIRLDFSHCRQFCPLSLLTSRNGFPVQSLVSFAVLVVIYPVDSAFKDMPIAGVRGWGDVTNVKANCLLTYIFTNYSSVNFRQLEQARLERDEDRRATWLETRNLEENFKQLVYLSMQEVNFIVFPYTWHGRHSTLSPFCCADNILFKYMCFHLEIFYSGWLDFYGYVSANCLEKKKNVLYV